MKGTVMRIDFTHVLATSDGTPLENTERNMSVLFNDSVISEKEVRDLISKGLHEHDERVVCMTERQANYLRGEE